MRDGRADGRALAWALAGFWAVSGCARGGDVNSSGMSIGMTDPGPGTTTTTSPPDSTTTAVDPSSSSASEDDTGSMQTMMVLCGDGVLDADEECDDGNLDNTDECTNSCKLPACGDLFVQGLEACDDGNTDDSDDCTSMCTVAVCGDGAVHAGIEACDDGNVMDGDMCSSLCTIPGCGDGVVDMLTEQCDDSNAINTDACTAMCQNAICGDAIVFEGSEECDDGNPDAADGCEPDCTITQKVMAVGPQINFPEASLSGWTPCWKGDYNAVVPVVDILAGCTRANLMLACRPIGSPDFALLAHAPREAVLTDTGTTNTPTNANGSAWYFNDSFSWGFAKEGDLLQRNSCDTGDVNPEQRLCWHTSAGSTDTGYRCGNNNLNGDATWERVVLHAN
jgi:cysteine-rich repeat protein